MPSQAQGQAWQIAPTDYKILYFIPGKLQQWTKVTRLKTQMTVGTGQEIPKFRLGSEKKSKLARQNKVA